MKYLEGLRGVAAIIVVLHHLRLTCFTKEYEGAVKLIQNAISPKIIEKGCVNILELFSNGNLAVWIFWVLSSYVISKKLFLKHKAYDQLIISYFSKRYFRLAFPVFISILIAYLLLYFGLMFNLRYYSITKNEWLHNFYNFKPGVAKMIKCAFYDSFFDFKTNTTYNAVLWTIQREFIGSLFIFSIFGVLRHNKCRHFFYLAIFIILIALGYIWLSSFIIGYAICDIDSSSSKSIWAKKLVKLHLFMIKYSWLIFILSLFLMIFSIDIFNAIRLPVDYHYLILSTIVVLFCLKLRHFTNFFSMKIPVLLGKLSFGIYLLHFPIICSFTCYLLLIQTGAVYKCFAIFATIILIFLASFLFSQFIDKYAVLFSNKIGDYFKKQSR